MTAPGSALAALARELPKHLSASWLAVSALYLVGARSLPEPWLALLVGTGVGILAATVTAMLVSDTPPADPLPPERYPMPVGPPGYPAPLAGLEPAGPMPAAPPPPGPPSPRAPEQPRRPLDFGRYAGADHAEVQCPNCGRFDVDLDLDRTSPRPFRCLICGQRWHADTIATNDVIIRSWLSP